MPTIRESRYEQLRRMGFLRAESLAYSKFDYRKVPYLMQMVNKRNAEYQQFNLRNQRLTPADRMKQWKERIQRACLSNGWYKDWTNPNTGRTQRVIDPWAALRSREDIYKPRHPQYNSPHVKRWRDFQSFDRKLEKSLAYS